MRTTIVIPTYNEADNIEKLIRAVFALGIENLYLIIVDDNSSDGTARIVKKLSREFPITLIERPAKLGIGSAYITGFEYALKEGADLIFEMDADGSHQSDMIPEFLEAMHPAHTTYQTYATYQWSQSNRSYTSQRSDTPPDLIIGSRRIPDGNVEGWDWRRNLQSRAASWLTRTVLHLKTNDVTSGFRCYRAEVLQKIPLKNIASNGYAFQVEILWWCERLGFKVSEIPIHFIDRRHGKSKLSKMEILKFFATILRLFLNKFRI